VAVLNAPDQRFAHRPDHDHRALRNWGKGREYQLGTWRLGLPEERRVVLHFALGWLEGPRDSPH
jgi:hypothetical protein